jgi:hypothetical protein
MVSEASGPLADDSQGHEPGGAPAAARTGTDGVCPLPRPIDWSGIARIERSPQPPLPDYRAAMAFALGLARERQGEPMLLSWYDRDRDFESPQHASECHQGSAVPGYVDYGIHHGASLCIDLEGGRFVFFYLDAVL